MESECSDMSFCRRHFPVLGGVFKWMVISACIGILLIIVASVALNIHGSVLLRRARERAEREGVPLTGQAYRGGRERLDERENAALVYNAAFSLMRAVEPREIYELMDEEDWPVGIEDLPLAADIVERTRTLLRERELILEILREGRRFKMADYDIAFDDPACRLHHLGPARRCARLLSMATLLAYHDGRADEAIGYALDGLALARSFSREPLLFSSDYERMIVSISLGWPLFAALGLPEVSEGKLAALQDALLDYSRVLSLRGALEGDVVHINSFYEAVLRGDFERLEYWNGEDLFPVARNRLSRWLAAGWLKSHQAYSIERVLDGIHDLQLPVSQIQASRKERTGFASWKGLWFLAMMIRQPGNQVVFHCEEVRVMMQSAALSAAAVRFYRAAGEWPDILDDLVERYVEDVPRDPFTGEPLIYRVLDDGIIIYSVGGNFTDDGGRPRLVPTPERERRLYRDAGFRVVLGEK